MPPDIFLHIKGSFLLSGGWYPPLQIERSGTSVSASPLISTESATSLGDLSPTSFFISEATSFCGQRPQLCLMPYALCLKLTTPLSALPTSPLTRGDVKWLR